MDRYYNPYEQLALESMEHVGADWTAYNIATVFFDRKSFLDSLMLETCLTLCYVNKYSDTSANEWPC